MNPYIQYMYSYPHKTAYRSLEGVFLKDYAPLLAGGGHGLYLHIPFCQAKCGYCNLFSVTGQGEEAVEGYLDAVERQGRQYREVLAPFHAQFSGLAIGGGTPLFLTEKQLDRVFGLLEEYFDFNGERELTVETAPNQTTGEKLRILKQAGATRVSMGIQSFCDGELSALRRPHNAGRAREALELLKSFGFPCVNVDFIYGIPGQTAESLLESLREALRFEPDEIFLYPLYVKHGAGLEGEGVVPDSEAALQQYRQASRFLRKEGFRQDSMRRFVRGEGEREFSECGLGTSLALGCGGRSYLGRLHFCSPYAITRGGCLVRLKEYENTVDFTVINHGIILTEEELKRRYVIRHLLIRPGLHLGRYREQFGSGAEEDFPLLADWLERGFVEKKMRGSQSDGNQNDENHSAGEQDAEAEDYLVLTDAGLELSDYLGPQLTSPQVRQDMEEWEVIHGRTHDFIPGQPEKL